MAAIGQKVAYIGGDVAIVFDDEYAHGGHSLRQR
jgi:hypothetical protein